MVNREVCNPSLGVNLTGMREDFLQLAIGREISLSFCLVPSKEENDTQVDTFIGQTEDEEIGDSSPESSQPMVIDEKHKSINRNSSGLPDPVSLEIYLQYLFHETILVKAGKRRFHAPSQVSGAGQGSSLLGHFCLTIAHRIFSKRVLWELENLVLPCLFICLYQASTIIIQVFCYLFDNSCTCRWAEFRISIYFHILRGILTPLHGLSL